MSRFQTTRLTESTEYRVGTRIVAWYDDDTDWQVRVSFSPVVGQLHVTSGPTTAEELGYWDEESNGGDRPYHFEYNHRGHNTKNDYVEFLQYVHRIVGDERLWEAFEHLYNVNR